MSLDIEAHNAATHSLASLMARGDDLHSPRFYELQARRLVANALLVRGYLEPCVETVDRTILKQQRDASLTDREKVEEALYYAKQDVADLEATLLAMARHRDDFSPDDRDADREDRREAEQRHDEAAAQNAPQVRVS